ncbi:MAG: cupin domain-containing protein [Nitrospirota bacterium]
MWLRKLILAAIAQEIMQNKSIMITPAEIKWTPGPPSLPSGAKMVVLEGDPKRSEMVSMRILLPRNYKLMPHTHPVAERVTVVSGTLFFGPGQKMDKKKTKKLPAGSFFVMPPNTPMFGWTEDQETVIQINVMGPGILPISIPLMTRGRKNRHCFYRYTISSGRFVSLLAPAVVMA